MVNVVTDQQQERVIRLKKPRPISLSDHTEIVSECPLLPPLPESGNLSDMTVLCFDLETTGLDVATDNVVQFGYAVFENTTVSQTKDTLVNPGRTIPIQASQIHKIFDSDVSGAPVFGEVASDFHNLLLKKSFNGKKQVICGYNSIAYDLPLLNSEFSRAQLEPIGWERVMLDPLVWLRYHKRDWKSRRLQDVASHYKIECSNAHCASSDSIVTGQILFVMIEQGLIPNNIKEAFDEQCRLVKFLEREHAIFKHLFYVDRDDNTTVRIGFGQYAGATVASLPRSYKRFLLDKRRPFRVEMLTPRAVEELEMGL